MGGWGPGTVSQGLSGTMPGAARVTQCTPGQGAPFQPTPPTGQDMEGRTGLSAHSQAWSRPVWELSQESHIRESQRHNVERKWGRTGQVVVGAGPVQGGLEHPGGVPSLGATGAHTMPCLGWTSPSPVCTRPRGLFTDTTRPRISSAKSRAGIQVLLDFRFQGTFPQPEPG